MHKYQSPGRRGN